MSEDTEYKEKLECLVQGVDENINMILGHKRAVEYQKQWNVKIFNTEDELFIQMNHSTKLLTHS